jgi:hypothetical protein
LRASCAARFSDAKPSSNSRILRTWSSRRPRDSSCRTIAWQRDMCDVRATRHAYTEAQSSAEQSSNVQHTTAHEEHTPPPSTRFAYLTEEVESRRLFHDGGRR